MAAGTFVRRPPRTRGRSAVSSSALCLALSLAALWACAVAPRTADAQCPEYINTPTFPEFVAGESVSGLQFTISALPAADVTLTLSSTNTNLSFTPAALQWTPVTAQMQSVTISAVAGSWPAISTITYALSGTNSLATDYRTPASGQVKLHAQRTFQVPAVLLSLAGGAGPSAQQTVTTPTRPAVDVSLRPRVPELIDGSGLPWVTFNPPVLTFTNLVDTLTFTATATSGVTGGVFAVEWVVTGTNAASFQQPANSTQPIACASGFNASGPLTCTDIDECVTGTAVCDARSYCVNYPGSYVCTPFVVENSIFVANGSGSPTVPGSGVLLGDTRGGQVLGMTVDVGVGDLQLHSHSLFGWPLDSPFVAGRGRTFVCTTFWTNLTGAYTVPPANVYGQPPNSNPPVRITMYCITAPAIGLALQLNVGYAAGKTKSLIGFGKASADVISYPPCTITPHSLRLDATAQLNPGTDELVAVNAFGENVRFSGFNFFPDPELLPVYYGAPATAHRPNPPVFRCTVDRVRTTWDTLVCLTATNGLAYGVGLLFTVTSSGVNVTGTDRYSYHTTPVIRSVYSPGCTGPQRQVLVSGQSVTTVSGCPTNGSVGVNVTGSGFLAPVSVIINGVPCTNPLLGAGTPFNSVDPETGIPLRYSMIWCLLPAGTGASQQMLVSSGELFSAPAPAVSYAAPTISRVSGCPSTASSLLTQDCSRHGDTKITIEGANFGTGAASVRVGINDCLNVTHWPGAEHTKLTCITTGGTATNQPVTVVQFNGLISTSPASLSYELCPAGQYLMNGTRDCNACPVGRFSPVAGQTTCSDCAPGTFASSVSSIACTPCPRNTVQPGPGASACNVCPNTQFQSSQGQQSCTQCGTNQYVADPTAINPCVPCPLGATCDASGVHANDGVFLISDKVAGDGNAGLGNLRSLNCLPGLCVKATQCGVSNITCCGTNRINAEANPLCGKCLDGFSDVNGTCVKCDKPEGGFLFLLLIASWLYVMVFHFLSSSKSSNETKIFLYFVQGTLLFFGGRTGLLSWASFLDFNIFNANNSSTPVCIWPLTGLQTMMMGFVFPLIALGQLWITYALRECCWAAIGRREKMRRTQVLSNALELTQLKGGNSVTPVQQQRVVSASVHNRAAAAIQTTQHKGWLESAFDAQDYNSYIRTSVALFLFSYNSIVSTIFEFLDCTEVAPGVSVITSQPSVSCQSDEYTKVRIFIYVMLALIVCLVPVVIVIALYVAYLLNRTIDPIYQTRYGLLFEGYKTTCFWFEAYVLMRRVTIIALLVALRNNTTVFSWVSLANILFLFLHGVVNAYALPAHNRLETYTLWVHCILTVMLATAHNPLTAAEALGFSCLIFATGGVFLIWLIYAKSQELLLERQVNLKREQRRKRLVEMSYEQTALAAVNEEDVLLVRLSDGTLARVYAPGLGVKQAAAYEAEKEGSHRRQQTRNVANEYRKELSSMSDIARDAAIVTAPAAPVQVAAVDVKVEAAATPEGHASAAPVVAVVEAPPPIVPDTTSEPEPSVTGAASAVSPRSNPNAPLTTGGANGSTEGAAPTERGKNCESPGGCIIA